MKASSTKGLGKAKLTRRGVLLDFLICYNKVVQYNEYLLNDQNQSTELVSSAQIVSDLEVFSRMKGVSIDL